MPLLVEQLSPEHNIQVVIDAIGISTSERIGLYESDGVIDGYIPQSKDKAWQYARHESVRIAREKTGRKLPEA